MEATAPTQGLAAGVVKKRGCRANRLRDLRAVEAEAWVWRPEVDARAVRTVAAALGAEVGAEVPACPGAADSAAGPQVVVAARALPDLQEERLGVGLAPGSAFPAEEQATLRNPVLRAIQTATALNARRRRPQPRTLHLLRRLEKAVAPFLR